jgi:hypothetical protein
VHNPVVYVSPFLPAMEIAGHELRGLSGVGNRLSETFNYSAGTEQMQGDQLFNKMVDTRMAND